MFLSVGLFPCDGSEITSRYQSLITPLSSANMPELNELTLIGTGEASEGNVYDLNHIGGHVKHQLTSDEKTAHSHHFAGDNTGCRI